MSFLKYISVFVVLILQFLLFANSVFAQSTGFLTDAVTTGFSVPEGVAEGVTVKTVFKDVRKFNLQDRYLLLNDDPFIPTTMAVGDILKITNITTGASFTFDSNCSVNKLPSKDLTYLIDPNGYNEFDKQTLKFEFINKCQTAKNVGEIYLYYKHISDTFPFPSPYTDFKQTDPQWGSLRLNNLSSCGTLYGYGCAVTSVADVFASYGNPLLSDNSIITPGNLNNWLTQNRGFAVCSIYWGAASGAIKIGAPLVGGRNGSSEWIAGKQAIDNALSAGNLVILGVNTKANDVGTHFLVVSEKLPDVNGEPDYKIIDPALYPFTPNNLGKTGMALSQAYGGFDKVFQYVIYRKNSASQNTLAIGAHSPIQLLITDPFGNQTGFNATTGEVIENIPESSYVFDPGITPVDDSSPAADETKYFQQINPSIGEYTIKVIGTGEGEYTVGFSKTDAQGNVSMLEVHGLAHQGSVEIYQVQNILDAAIPVLVKKEATFQSLKDNVNEVFNLTFITQKSVANSLIRNLEQAENASLNGDTNKVLQNLDQFINVLQRERGRKIAEKAYLMLFDNVNFLKGHYLI